ncbi:MAG: DNA topoisomerase I [Candidatus Pacearchaeota archaeon]
MPRKAPQKSKEEKLAEGFFPVDADDLKRAIEKPTKVTVQREEFSDEPKKPRETRETSKKTTRTKKSKTTKTPKVKEFKTPEISLKKNGYELIITEKPQAASKISDALSNGKARRNSVGNVSYYEFENPIEKGKEVVVACTVGHLLTLKQDHNVKVGEPVFDISWIPNYMARKGDFTKRYYEVLSRLAKGAGSITVATDYDIEGEVIGFNAVRFICGQKDASRMKFSTLTEKELNESYNNKSSSLDWGQAIAGETRHYLDWIYGINLSRALMNSLKSIGRFRIMSIGRVQGPTLKLLVEKEKSIKDFKSETYWQVFLKLKDSELELKHNRDLSRKSDLKKFEYLKGKDIEVRTEKREQLLQPNPPFNLTTLQTEAYNLYGISPNRTLQIAQSLYLNGLISYPRTSSQKLPASINYREILNKVSEKYNVEDLIKRKNPIEGKKSDPAHPSIYPTGNSPSSGFPDDEAKVFSLIEKRFLALFCEDAIIDNKKIIAEKDKLIFSTSGLVIREKNWMKLYPVKMNEKEIPDIDGSCEVENVRTEEKQTQPPRRYSPASIISILEKRNLGTKATRTGILETLYTRNYIKEKSIEATSLGISLIDTLEKYSPIIVDEKLTRDFEKEMEGIQNAQSGFEEKKKKILEKAKQTLIKILENFSKHEQDIGKELFDANVALTEKLKEENKLVQCPVCKKGDLAITYSKKTQRYFVACNAYPNCKTTFSLPPNGLIKKSGKICEGCGYLKLIRLSKGRRPWEFCFNPECEDNKKRLEEYRKKQLGKEGQ